MSDTPDNINQSPETPILPDSVETQSTGVVIPYTHEYIARILEENVRSNKKIEILGEHIEQYKIEKRHLIHQLTHDDLTGLPNRRYIVEWMRENLDQISKFFMFSMDLKKFKVINDRYGHDVGDSALQLMAEVAREVVYEITSKNTEGFIARPSGDEFIGIFAGDVNPMTIAELLNVRLASKFNTGVISHDGNDIRNIPFMISQGIASDTDIPSYLEDLRQKHEKALEQNSRELLDIERSLKQYSVNNMHNIREILEGNRKVIEADRKKLEENFLKVCHDTRFGLTWKIAELALQSAKKATDNICIYDEKCLLPIHGSELVDALVKDIESGLRNIKDIESAKEFCESLPKKIHEFLSKISEK